MPDGLADAGYPRKWWILAAVSLSQFLGSIDGSIVNVALPTLMKELHANFPTIQWVVLAYLLGLSVMMVGMGRLADLIGKKVVFASGIVIFVAGSALCGLAPTVNWLIAFRVVQSIGAAMMLALGAAIITQTWPRAQRGQAIGIASGIISFGIVLGPAVGGFLLEWLSWRWIFYVNLPVGLLGLFLVLKFVPPLQPARDRESFDFSGAAALGFGMLVFALALTLGQNNGFRTPAVPLLLASFVAVVPIFFQIERRVRYPIVDLSLFRQRPFTLNLVTGWLAFVALAGIVLLLPFYLQTVVGLSLRDTGLMMAVVPIVIGLVQPITGTLSDRLGTHPVSFVGLLLMFVGYLSMSTLQVDGTAWGYFVRMLPISLGIATFQSPNNSAIMGSAPPARLGVVSSILSLTRTLGQVIGISLLGAFFSSRLQVYTEGADGLRSAAPEAIVAALGDQFLLAAGLIAIGLVTALLAWRWDRAAPRQDGD